MPTSQGLLTALFLASVQFACPVWAFGDGAPSHRCSNLVPMHGPKPQASVPPYELVLGQATYSPGDSVQVTLRGLGGDRFLGFALTARRLAGDTEELVGGFDSTRGTTGGFWYSQNASLPNCMTHSAGQSYTSLTVQWIAPSRSVGDVVFTTPVVQSFNTFWSNVTSAVLTASVSSADPPFPPLHEGPSPNPMSGSCGANFGCVRSPALCDPATCEILVKFHQLEPAEQRLRMEIQAKGSYVSVGLSEDDKMSDDLTLTCMRGSSGSSSMQLGYNPKYRRLNERHRWTPLREKYIEQLEGGRIRCEFSLPLGVNVTTYPDPRQASGQPIVRSFDLRQPHFVLVAYGDVYPGTNSVHRHTEMPAISVSRVNLLSTDIVSAHRLSPLRRAHGSLMLIAWQLLVPLAANLAMFYRCLFMRSFGGAQLWFHLHRGFMVAAFLLSIVGVLLIFAQFGWKWSTMYSTTQTHGIMGLTVLSLAAVQIVMGMLRPDKDATRRPIFNIAHRAVAYTVLSLAQHHHTDRLPWRAARVLQDLPQRLCLCLAGVSPLLPHRGANQDVHVEQAAKGVGRAGRQGEPGPSEVQVPSPGVCGVPYRRSDHLSLLAGHPHAVLIDARRSVTLMLYQRFNLTP